MAKIAKKWLQSLVLSHFSFSDFKQKSSANSLRSFAGDQIITQNGDHFLPELIELKLYQKETN